jgi:multidrug transporter EmrE-like cation transporter
MTLIKQSCCFVTILAGKFIFHEKKILHKFLCACVIVAGIIVSVVLK